MDNKNIENKQRAKLLVDLAKSVSYWMPLNRDYAQAYMNIIHVFSMPQTDEEDNETN